MREARIKTVGDLMQSLGRDISQQMTSAMSVVDKRERLPVALAALAGGVAIVAAILNEMSEKPSRRPDEECLLLAGLLTAHAGMTPGKDSISDAYRDLKILMDRRALEGSDHG